MVHSVEERVAFQIAIGTHTRTESNSRIWKLSRNSRVLNVYKNDSAGPGCCRDVVPSKKCPGPDIATESNHQELLSVSISLS